MTKFGFELEWQSNALPLVEWLHANHPDVMGCSGIHGYHCGCEECDFSYPLKANRDSSCAGEIVSRPFRTIDEALPIFDLIQEAAVEVDAEPGWDAGLHVHVDMSRTPASQRAATFVEFLRWQNVFVSFAIGRFEYLRDNNRSPLDNLLPYIRNIRDDAPWCDVPREIIDADGNYIPNPSWREPARFTMPLATHWLSQGVPPGRRMNLYAGILDYNNNCDRHSYLCTHTRYGTWEFRVFNSTRSAWRMELSCELARAWANWDFVSGLRSYRDQMDLGTMEKDKDHFIATLNGYSSHAAELATKQLAYQKKTNFLNLPNFTV